MTGRNHFGPEYIRDELHDIGAALQEEVTDLHAQGVSSQ